jgi:hypothetical protein
MKENLTELEMIARRIEGATRPEDIFGLLEGSGDKFKDALSIYRQLSRKTHPDLYMGSPDQLFAQSTFSKLTTLWEKARARIGNGTYGMAEPETSITTKRHSYKVFEQTSSGEVSNLYRCTFEEKGTEIPAIFKITRESSDNDLLENEARILKELSNAPDYSEYHHYFPNLVESFRYIDPNDPSPRHVNILTTEPGLYSLLEVRQAYPDGIDPKDMAWMWRRLLVGSGFAHQQGIINAGLIPTNVFIHPKMHGMVLMDWSSAVSTATNPGEKVSVISTQFEKWYPREVFDKLVPTPALDIYMGARLMDSLLPDSVNPRISRFIKGCALEYPLRRPQDAWSLLKEFTELVESLWGPRKFHQFCMPEKKKGGD